MDAVNYAIEYAAEVFYIEKQNVQIKAREIAESKADQLKVEDQNREEFIQSIIHDLNSPLNNIKACIEMLEGSLELDQTRKIFEILKASLNQADLLIEEFLNVGSIDSSSHLPVNKSKVNVVDELKQQLKIYEISYKRNFTLSSTEKEIFAELDINLIRRAFNNLINNALKHGMPSKPISVVCDQNKDFVSISVRNEGKKVPENILNSIFNRYYKTEESAKGWGIGLAFVKKVVDAHQGKVSVESNKNGTTFKLEIPK